MSCKTSFEAGRLVAGEIAIILRFEMKRKIRSSFGDDRDDAFAFAQSLELLGAADVGLIRAGGEEGERHFTGVEFVLDLPGPNRSTVYALRVQPGFEAGFCEVIV
jgi:hypothetical protein